MAIEVRELRHTRTVELSTADDYKYGDPRASLLIEAGRFLLTHNAIFCGIDFDRVRDEDIAYALLTYEAD